jgi:hypothetical protein
MKLKETLLLVKDKDSQLALCNQLFHNQLFSISLKRRPKTRFRSTTSYSSSKKSVKNLKNMNSFSYQIK